MAKFLLPPAEATVKAQITLPGAVRQVLFEDRTIQLADGVLTDTFTNYGTRLRIESKAQIAKAAVDVVDVVGHGGRR